LPTSPIPGYITTLLVFGEEIVSDKDQIAKLVSIASDRHQLQAAQHEAAQRLLHYDGEVYPHDGCAITLSVLLQDAGIQVPDVYQAIALGDSLKTARNWQVVAVGRQWPKNRPANISWHFRQIIQCFD
jgi:hypothetical protein